MNYLSKREKVFVLIVLISIAILAGGCTTYARPYVEVGLAYQLDQNTDYWLQKDRDWQCSNGLQGQLEVGYHISEPVLGNDHIRIGYHHESWVNCGGPFNKRAEVYQDDIRVVYHMQF